MIADPNDTKRFEDEQTNKRIHELLLNENDTVSEKDISNIRTDIVVESEKSAAGQGIRDDSDPEIDTVWNIEEGNN